MEGRLGANVRLLFVGLVLLAGSACAGRIHPGTPAPGDGRDDGGAASFVATAYCQGTRTATGTRPDERTIAADPGVLPLGSRIRVSGLDGHFRRLNRTYVVGDTGASIQGRRLDIYMRNCRDAVAFGRRTVRVTVVRRAGPRRSR